MSHIQNLPRYRSSSRLLWFRALVSNQKQWALPRSNAKEDLALDQQRHLVKYPKPVSAKVQPLLWV